MKKTNRIIVAVLLALTLLFLLTACGEKDPACGTYTCTVVKSGGMEINVKDVLEEGVALELKDNGKGTIILDGEDYKLQWERRDDGFALIIDDEESLGTIDANNTIVIDLLGAGMTYTFVKDANNSEEE